MADDLEIEIAAAKAKAKKRKGLGERIWENLVGDNDPNTQNTGEKIGSWLNMAGEAASFGLVGDEASAKAADIIPGGMDYNQRLDFERQQQRIYEDENPVGALTAQVSGGAAAPVMAATSLPGAIGIGAFGGLTYGFMEGENGFGERATRGAGGAALGGLFGAASVPLGKVVGWAARKGGTGLRRVFGNGKLYSPKQGLTKEGRETLEAMGYNIDELSSDFQKAFQRQYDDLADPMQAGRVAAMDEFSIPAYRHNATGTADDFAQFERARRGALGEGLETTARNASDRQAMATQEAAENISGRLGGGGRADQYDAAIAVQSALRGQRDKAQRAATAAYDDLAEAGGGVRGVNVRGLGSELRRRVGQTFNMSEGRTPNAIAALDEVDSLFAKADSGAVPFGKIEQARQSLNRYLRTAQRGTNEADTEALRRAIGAMDERVDELMTTAMTEGDAAVVSDAAKRARGLWKQYSQQFKGDGAASKFIQKMIDEDASPDDMVKWLFSSGKLGGGRFNSTLAKGLKDVLGEGSDEWGMVRQAAFRQLWQKPNTESAVQWGPQRISERIGEFLNSPSTRGLLKELYSPKEIALMRRYNQALKNMVAPPGAVNYSGTAYENTRMVRQLFNMLGTAIGGASGGGAGAVAAGGAISGVQKGSNWLAGRGMLSPSGRAGAASGRAASGAGVLGGEVGGAAADQFIRQPLQLELNDPGNATTR